MMGKTNKCNIEEDRGLAEEVRKYRCLYDKSDKGYKEKDRTVNAWRTVDDAVGYEEGAARKKFEILKKRFSRKRNILKKVSASGSGLAEVTGRQKDLDDYSFMTWLTPFIRQRSTKSNLSNYPQNSNCNEMSVECGEDEISDSDEEGSDGYDIESKPMSVANVASSSFSRTEGKRVSSKRKVEVGGQGVKRVKQSELLGTETDVTKSASKILTQKLEKTQSSSNAVDADDIFGKMIASELKQFPEHLKFQVKHELNSVIYEYRLQHMSSQMNRTHQFVQSQLPSSNPTQHFQPSSSSSPTQQMSPTAQGNPSSLSEMND